MLLTNLKPNDEIHHMNNMEIIEDVATNLKRLRLSKAWAALQIGVTYHHLQQVMRGKCVLSDSMKEKLMGLNDKLKSFGNSLAV